MEKQQEKGHPKNQYAKKKQAGKTAGLYISAENMEILRRLLVEQGLVEPGKEPADNEAIKLARKVFVRAMQEQVYKRVEMPKQREM